MRFSSRAPERSDTGFLETEKKGQDLKIVVRPVLERSSSKLSLQLNLNMLQLRGSALWIDIVIIMLRGKESFTCGSVWLTGLQLWWLETAAVCPNYRAPRLTAQDTQASHRQSVVSSEKKMELLSCFGLFFFFFCHPRLQTARRTSTFVESSQGAKWLIFI